MKKDGSEIKTRVLEHGISFIFGSNPSIRCPECNCQHIPQKEIERIKTGPSHTFYFIKITCGRCGCKFETGRTIDENT